MMLFLIRQNPALRSLARWLVISAVTAAAIFNLIAFVALKRQVIDSGVDLSICISLLWLALSIYLIFGEVGTRCSPFEMALPISTRRLWLSHLLSITLAGAAVLTVAIAVIAGGVWLFWKLSGKLLLQVEGIGSIAQIYAGLILAVALLQKPRPPVRVIPRTLGGTGITVLTAAAILGLIIILLPYSPLFALIPLVAALAVAFLRYRNVPVIFTLVPAEPQAATGIESEPEASFAPGTMTREAWAVATVNRSRSSLGFKWFLSKTIHKCSLLGITRKMTLWFTIPFLLIFGALLSGIDGHWLDLSLRYAYIAMAVYILVAFTGMPMAKLGILDWLPIPRRHLLAVLILPSFLTLMVGYGVGRIGLFFLEHSTDQKKELIAYVQEKNEKAFFIHMPIGYCRIAWSGEPPAADSPWGETHRVWCTPLFKGSPIKIFLPSGSGPENTLEFVALQLSRSTEAVYGEAVPPQEIKDRYLEVQSDGTVGLKGEALTIQADYPRLEPRWGGPVFPVMMLLVGLLWTPLILLYLRAFRAGVTKRRRMAAHWGVAAIAFAIWVAQYVIMLTGLMQLYVAIGFLDILIRQAGETPGGVLTVWFVCALPLFGAYRMVARRFERVDFPYEFETN